VRNPISPYLEQTIASASPLELIRLYYQTAIQAVRDARAFLAQRNIKERVRCINLAHGVLAELFRSLDKKAGDGKLAGDLGRLYAYMMRRLLDANFRQADEPLAETLNLLLSLAEAWNAIAALDASAHAASAPESWHLPNESESSNYSASF
jgi:flagellar protein FliS